MDFDFWLVQIKIMQRLDRLYYSIIFKDGTDLFKLVYNAWPGHVLALQSDHNFLNVFRGRLMGNYLS